MISKIRDFFYSRWIFIIFFVALILRIIYLFEGFGTPVLDFLYIDSEYYHKWAIQIAGGDILGGDRIFFLAPFYAYFLALVYSILGANFLNALFIQIIIGSISCILIFLIADKYFNRRTAIISGILSAIYPLFIFYDVVLLKENLMVFFSLIFAYVYPIEISKNKPALKIFRNIILPEDWLKYLLCGIFIAIISLMRANIFILLPFLVYFEYKRNNRTDFIKKSLIFTFGLFIIIFPVALRNKIVGGEWVITVAEGGMNFWTGNNPNANGAYVGADFIRSQEPEFEDEDFRLEASKRIGRELTLKEASDYWYKQSLKFITNYPSRFIWLLYRKFIAFWHNVELPSDLNFYLARDFSKLLKYNFVTFGIIVPFAVMGMLFSRKKVKGNYLFLSLIFSNLFSSLIFFNSSRYRLPVVPFFILYSGFYFNVLYGVFVETYVKKFPPKKHSVFSLILITFPLFVLTNYKDELLTRISSTRVSYLNAATYYMKTNDYDNAEKMLQKSLEIDPYYALGYEKYSQLLNLKGDKKNAEEYYKKSLRYKTLSINNVSSIKNSFSEEETAFVLFNKREYKKALDIFLKILDEEPQKEKELRNNIGLCYLKLNDFDNAEKNLFRAVAIDKKYDKAYYNIGLLYEQMGKNNQAERYFQKTLSINPNYSKAKQKLSVQ